MKQLARRGEKTITAAKNQLIILALAVQFLTRLPVPVGDGFTPERLTAAVRYYPLVGVLVGALIALVFWLSNLILPLPLSVLIALAFGVLLTGAFHEDGLADMFDGIGGGHTREQALAIMKDSRIGTYGTLALVAAFGLKAGALIATPAAMIPLTLIAAHGLSRLSAVGVIATSTYVRDNGTGKPVADGLSGTSLMIAGATGLAIIMLWLIALPLAAIACALVGLLIGHALMRLFFERKLGGYTGDTLGAVQQASEIGFLIGLLAWL